MFIFLRVHWSSLCLSGYRFHQLWEILSHFVFIYLPPNPTLLGTAGIFYNGSLMLLHLFLSFFFLCFILGSLYCNVFKFIELSSCSVLFAVNCIWYIFLDIYFFHLLKFSLGLLYHLFLSLSWSYFPLPSWVYGTYLYYSFNTFSVHHFCQFWVCT